jgi:hypothetical protein
MLCHSRRAYTLAHGTIEARTTARPPKGGLTHLREISRQFAEAWPFILAAFVAGWFAGWRRADNWRRKRDRERYEMQKGASR